MEPEDLYFKFIFKFENMLASNWSNEQNICLVLYTGYLGVLIFQRGKIL